MINFAFSYYDYCLLFMYIDLCFFLVIIQQSCFLVNGQMDILPHDQTIPLNNTCNSKFHRSYSIAYLISGAVMPPIAGKLSDIYGKKKILLIIMTLLVV
jgi:hypothetical protein